MAIICFSNPKWLKNIMITFTFGHREWALNRNFGLSADGLISVSINRWVKGLVKKCTGGGGQEKMKTRFLKKHDPPPVVAQNFGDPPRHYAEKNMTHPHNSTSSTTFFITFSLYICSIECHIQHVHQSLISKNGQYSCVLMAFNSYISMQS